MSGGEDCAMQSSFRVQILLVLIFASFVPVLLAGSILTWWALEFSRSQDQLSASAHAQVKASVVSKLERVQARMDSITQSRELADFLHANETTREYTANLLYGRVEETLDDLAGVKGWAVFDARGRLLAGSSQSPIDAALAARQESDIGQDAATKTILLKRAVKYDDQNLSGPASTFIGKLIVTVSKRELAELTPGLAQIGEITAVDPSGMEISIRPDLLPPSVPVIQYLSLLVFGLLVSACIALGLVRLRVLLPLAQLTAEVVRKSKWELPKDVRNEVILLQQAFAAYEDYITKVHEELLSQTRLAAAGRVTSMLAHDVRKPFTMFKLIIDAVESTRDPEQVKVLLRQSMPEVQRAMASVNGMIQDVMQIGGESHLTLEPTDFASLLDAALTEIFRVYPQSTVDLKYDLKHEHSVMVDSLKMNRVLSNIVGNALQAMKFRGRISFGTRHLPESPFLELTIENTGSFIPAESREKVFDLFFTSEKKDGTGLGLAIAKKIILEHGGRIWCESEKDAKSPDGLVRFCMTLPMDVTRSSRKQVLPQSSLEIISSFRVSSVGREREGRQDTHEEGLREISRLETEVEQKLRSQPELCRTIMIVDDEAIYRDALRSLLARSKSIDERLQVVLARNSTEALDLARRHDPFLSILDVDLGPGSLNGLETVAALRDAGHQMRISVHSNRFLASDYRTAIEAGANTVLPKPMGHAHLLKLILEALAISTESGHAPHVEEVSAREQMTKTGKPRMAVIDDSTIVLMSWQMRSKSQMEVLAFESPASFRKACEEDVGLINSLTAIVTDFQFAPGVHETGMDFARSLREQGCAVPILLSSDGMFDDDAVKVSGIDAVIPKAPLHYDELWEFLETKDARRCH